MGQVGEDKNAMAESIVVISDPGPEFLYRYRSIDGDNLEYLRRTLVDNEVYLASPKDLNDPFDCRIKYELTKQPKDKIRAVIDRELSFMEPDLSRHERRKRVMHEMKLKLYKQPEFWEKITGAMQTEIDRQGVLCLTESADHPLMWAHYASGHSGVCLKLRHTGFFDRAQRVLYNDEPRTIDPYDDSLVGLDIVRLTLTKATAWAYEKEWRIVDHVTGSGVHKFAPHLLSAVILGMKMGEREREKICHWVRLRSHPTQLLQAKESNGNLIFETL
jgi:Protein of unknown function (DUF2971)